MDFYNKFHRRLHRRKNFQAALCGTVMISAFVGFMTVPSQTKKIDLLKLGSIAVSLLSAAIGLVVVESKKDLDAKSQLLAYTEDKKLGEHVGAEISIEQEKIRASIEQRLNEILQPGGNS